MIGIISFHCQYNYGSALQAWALQTKLEQLGYPCKFLNYYYEHDMRIYDIRWYSRRLPVIVYDLLVYPAMLRKKRAFRTFHADFLRLTPQTTDWERLAELGKDCDALICGSDQIWNYDLTEGLHPGYFLDFAYAGQRKIAYAPSVNQNNIPEWIVKQLREKLQTFHAVSVREQDTADQLTELLGKDVPAVLDPTLLLDAQDYLPLLRNCSLKLPEHYVFVYCLHQNHLKQLRESAERYAAVNHSKIVYCSKLDLFHPDYACNIFRRGPEAFVYAIAHADHVLADSFHAAAFSVIFRKDFAICAPGGCNSRMNTLFSGLGLPDRFMKEAGSLLPPIDYAPVDALLQSRREASLAYLISALEE